MLGLPAILRAPVAVARADNMPHALDASQRQTAAFDRACLRVGPMLLVFDPGELCTAGNRRASKKGDDSCYRPLHTFSLLREPVSRVRHRDDRHVLVAHPDAQPFGAQTPRGAEVAFYRGACSHYDAWAHESDDSFEKEPRAGAPACR